jgi:hypothetical protein
MQAEEFVSRVVQSVNSVIGVPRLKLVFADLISFENVVLMGRGALNYSRHRNSKYNSARNFIDPCHTDYTEHKNNC